MSYFAVIHHVNLESVKSPMPFRALCRRASLECSKGEGEDQGRMRSSPPWAAEFILIRCTKQLRILALVLCENGGEMVVEAFRQLWVHDCLMLARPLQSESLFRAF